MNRREAIEKLEAKLSKLSPKILASIFGHGGVIAGGVFADTLLEVWHKDVDVYFPDAGRAALAYRKCSNRAPRAGKTNLQYSEFEFMRFISFPSPEEVIGSFDISATQIAYDGKMWYFGEHTLEDINNKYLRLLQVNSPIAVQTKRLTKYMEKGLIPDEHTFGVLCKHIKQGGDKIKTMYEDYKREEPTWAAHVIVDEVGNNPAWARVNNPFVNDIAAGEARVQW